MVWDNLSITSARAQWFDGVQDISFQEKISLNLLELI